MPSKAMQTMMPAKRTARPDVFTALMMEVSVVARRRDPAGAG